VPLALSAASTPAGSVLVRGEVSFRREFRHSLYQIPEIVTPRRFPNQL